MWLLGVFAFEGYDVPETFVALPAVAGQVPERRGCGRAARSDKFRDIAVQGPARPKYRKRKTNRGCMYIYIYIYTRTFLCIYTYCSYAYIYIEV